MEFNQIYKYPLLSFFAFIVVGLAPLLVALQLELVEYKIDVIRHLIYFENMISFLIFKWADHVNVLELIILLFLMMWLISLLFLLCEFGAQTTHRFEVFEEELDRCDWHLLPIRLQRMYLIFVSGQSMNISSFGGIKCERDTFKMV